MLEILNLYVIIKMPKWNIAFPTYYIRETDVASCVEGRSARNSYLSSES